MKKTALILILIASSLAISACCGSMAGCDGPTDDTVYSTSGCCGDSGW